MPSRAAGWRGADESAAALFALSVMKSNGLPLFYVILGPPRSERRSVLADLIADGLDANGQALTFLSGNEPPSDFDQQLGDVRTWALQDGSIVAEIPESIRDASDEAVSGKRYSHVFFMADGARNPVDQIEAIKSWIAPFDIEFARVITVIDCALASRHRELAAWWDACVHFSDVVLLSHRQGVPNKWMSDFQGRYRDRFIPALFEFVKEGKVRNPALVLEPQARRVSHVFDKEDGDWSIARRLAPEAEIDFDRDEDDGAESPEGDSGDEGAPEVDPYLERRQNGSRTIELPDIRKFLDHA